MLTDDVKRLIDRNLQANLQLLSRAGGVLRSAGQAARQPGNLRGTDTKAVAADLVRLQLDFYARLADQSVQYLNAVVSLAEDTLGSAAMRSADGRSEREEGSRSGSGSDLRQDGAEVSVDVSPRPAATGLSGNPGETLRFQFQLDNPNPDPVNASLESREWLGRAGQRVAADSLRLEPAATVIDARSARTVQGQLEIDARFEAGETYDTVIRVAGFPGREINLSLTVIAG